ncbi:MAG: PDZ domain-containing protein [Planctomycetota bacterium]|jgi:hypothetical protein
MDGQLADPTDPELAKLLDQFVLVRLVQMGGVDRAVFQFDPFLSWSLFFMNGDKTIYGRFGRAHPQTKRNKKDSNPNHSVAGLKAAMKRALEVHAGYTKDPATWSKRLAGKTGPRPRWRFTEKTPAARKYKRLKRIDPAGDGKGCVHCHEVQRTLIDSYIMKRIPIPDRMLWMYPRPEVLGLSFDTRHVARVTRSSSLAAAAGIKVGDDLRSMQGQPLLSIADIQWILHNYPDEGGKLTVNGGKTIDLPAGWRRKEDWVWRYRVAGYSSWMWAGVSFEDRPDGVLVAARAPQWFKRANPEPKRKLQRGDLIVAVDGKTGMDRSALLAYLMREKKLGSKVRLELRRRGEKQIVEFRIPSKQPEVQGY